MSIKSKMVTGFEGSIHQNIGSEQLVALIVQKTRQKNKAININLQYILNTTVN